MPVKFPHVGNDSYPHIENVRPFDRTVPFDYGRFDYTATIKLCNVQWPSDYTHVINWESETARDLWFSELSGHIVSLANGFARTQLDSIKVNVPYDVALTYNYVYMQIPTLTQDELIHHETTEGIRTVCAWIQEAIYQAPSATELVLSLDYWTTYLPHLQTDVGMILHRGHAPAYSVNVNDFLSNPKAHCEMLLTPDVNFGIDDEVASCKLIDIALGSKLLVLASTIPYSDMASMTISTSESGSTSAATYYDTGARNGYQVGVAGYDWHYGGYSYEGMENPSDYSGLGATMPTYEYLYAINASNAESTLGIISKRLPQFIKSIQAAYILPTRAVTLSSVSYQIANVTLYRVQPTSALNDISGITLDKESFGYPERYADIAKLYTSPYAHMVISDALGQSLIVRIEDMGANVRILEQISPLTDCLRWDILLSDVNAQGTNTYTWVAINSTSKAMSLPATDIGRYTLELGIPTYALYLDGKTAWAMDAYNEAQANRSSSIVAYQSAMRSANTAKENADDSADAAKLNADASADTAKANADASADTTKTNADASADAAKANADDSADAAKLNAYDTANVNVTNTANSGSNMQANATAQNNLRTLSTTENINTQTFLTEDAVQNIYDSSNADLEYAEDANDIGLLSESVTSIQNIVSNAIAGNAMGMVNSGVSGIVNMTTSAWLAYLSYRNILDHQGISQSHTRTANSYHTSNMSHQTTYSNNVNTLITSNNATTNNTNATNSANVAKANANRSQTTTKANAARTQTTTKANAARSQSTAKANAARTQTTTKANAARTQTTTKANAGYTRGTSEENSKATLEQVRNNYVRQGASHSLDNPVRFGSVSGNHEPDALMRRVLQVRVETQSASAIARAGDLMRRYGYAFDGYWLVTDWCPNNQQGCYWEASDVFIDAAAISNPSAYNVFVAILKAGVTVWNDPTKIGGLLPWQETSTLY